MEKKALKQRGWHLERKGEWYNERGEKYMESDI